MTKTTKTAQPKKIKAPSPGRPKTRYEELAPIPARCPASLLRYIKTVYPFQYNSLTELYEDVITRFLDLRPWERGLDWRQPRVSTARVGDGPVETGWVQVGVNVPKPLKKRVTATAKTEGVSAAAIVYTALFWYSMYIMPPVSTGHGQAGPKDRK